MVKSNHGQLQLLKKIGNTLEACRYLLKLQMLEHGNSIYFMCDIIQNPVTVMNTWCSIFKYKSVEISWAEQLE